MRFYEEVDFLPKLPDYFNWTLEEIETLDNGFPYEDFAHTFACYDAPKELHDFYQPYFNFDINKLFADVDNIDVWIPSPSFVNHKWQNCFLK